MKLPCAFSLALMLSASPLLHADEGEALDLSTVNGQTYAHCQILKVYPDGVAFRHSRGMAKLQFTDLTPEWRKHFGYDPEKVEAYERKVKEERTKDRQAAAVRAEVARQQWVENANNNNANSNSALEALLAQQEAMTINNGIVPYGYNDLVSPVGFGDLGSNDLNNNTTNGQNDTRRFYNCRPGATALVPGAYGYRASVHSQGTPVPGAYGYRTSVHSQGTLVPGAYGYRVPFAQPAVTACAARTSVYVVPRKK